MGRGAAADTDQPGFLENIWLAATAPVKVAVEAVVASTTGINAPAAAALATEYPRETGTIASQQGHAFNKRGLTRDAADAFLRACALEPANAQHRISAANMLFKLGDAAAALEQYTIAEALPQTAKLAEYTNAKKVEAAKVVEAAKAAKAASLALAAEVASQAVEAALLRAVLMQKQPEELFEIVDASAAATGHATDEEYHNAQITAARKSLVAAAEAAAKAEANAAAAKTSQGHVSSYAALYARRSYSCEDDKMDDLRAVFPKKSSADLRKLLQANDGNVGACLHAL